MSNSALRAPLVQVMQEGEPEERLQRLWYGIRERRDATRHAGFWRMNSRLMIAAAAVSCIVVVTAWSLRWSHLLDAANEAAVAIPARIEPGNATRRVDFGDGATVEVRAGARLDVLEQSDRLVVLALRQGLSQFDIRPGGARRWRIDSGGVTVEVVGTRFSVQRSETSVKVTVERGRVLVRGASVPDQIQSLDAGKSLVVALTAPRQPSPVEASPQPAPEPRVDHRPTLNTQHASSAQSVHPPLPPTSDWHAAATQQDWKQAWETLGAEGVAREAAHTDDVTDLLALADVARLSGHPQLAVTPLRQIIGGHPDDPRAAMAAFTLGRVLLDKLGQPMQASFAYERALSLKLPASLTEDALARLVEAQAKAGARAQASSNARTYRTKYPNGQRLAEVNRWSPDE